MDAALARSRGAGSRMAWLAGLAGCTPSRRRAQASGLSTLNNCTVSVCDWDCIEHQAPLHCSPIFLKGLRASVFIQDVAVIGREPKKKNLLLAVCKVHQFAL